LIIDKKINDFATIVAPFEKKLVYGVINPAIVDAQLVDYTNVSAISICFKAMIAVNTSQTVASKVGTFLTGLLIDANMYGLRTHYELNKTYNDFSGVKGYNIDVPQNTIVAKEELAFRENLSKVFKNAYDQKISTYDKMKKAQGVAYNSTYEDAMTKGNSLAKDISEKTVYADFLGKKVESKSVTSLDFSTVYLPVVETISKVEKKTNLNNIFSNLMQKEKEVVEEKINVIAKEEVKNDILNKKVIEKLEILEKPVSNRVFAQTVNSLATMLTKDNVKDISLEIMEVRSTNGGLMVDSKASEIVNAVSRFNKVAIALTTPDNK